jgi:hypothetical protein
MQAMDDEMQETAASPNLKHLISNFEGPFQTVQPTTGTKWIGALKM